MLIAAYNNINIYLLLFLINKQMSTLILSNRASCKCDLHMIRNTLFSEFGINVDTKVTGMLSKFGI